MEPQGSGQRGVLCLDSHILSILLHMTDNPIPPASVPPVINATIKGVLILFAIGLVIFVGITVFLESESPSVPTSLPLQKYAATVPVTTPVSSTMPTAFYGERVELVSSGRAEQFAIGKVYIIISSPEEYVSNSPFFQPGSGQKFVAVLVKFENVSEKVFGEDVGRFALVDAARFHYRAGSVGKDPGLDFERLNPGETARGYVTAIVPKEADLKTLDVHFELHGAGLAVDFKQPAIDSQPTDAQAR
ncbi:MAG: DUF4352 domain-containing protein [bacterium]|nr:DUF4352 domain-containing protein [bacterium]